MKSYRKEIWFEVPTRRAFINMTPQVEACLRESGIREGLLLCNAMHITASVFINDDEHGLHHDYEKWLEKLAPHEPVSQYRHNVGEDNADAHMKRQIMGREVVVAVTEGRLDLGTWERIFYRLRRKAPSLQGGDIRRIPCLLQQARGRETFMSECAAVRCTVGLSKSEHRHTMRQNNSDSRARFSSTCLSRPGTVP